MIQVVDTGGRVFYHQSAVGWQIDEGTLYVTGFERGVVAAYAAGQWCSVREETEEANTHAPT